MKILVVNFRDMRHPQAGGAEVHLHRIFGRLVDWGHQVLLFAPSFPGAPEREVVDGIEVERHGSDSTFGLHCLFRLPGVEKRFCPDVLVEDLNKIPLYTTVYTKSPKVIQIHHLWMFSVFREAVFPLALWVWLHERMIPWFYRGCAFAAVSPSSVSELAALGIPLSRIRLVYNGSEPEWLEIEPKKEKSPQFLWLGRMRRYKGVRVAYEAFRRLARTDTEATLVFAGAGPEASRIAASARKHGLDNRIQVLGRISESEKRELLRSSIALLQTSYKEGWGLTVIEAAACGTMAIASDAPGLRDSVRDGKTGLLFRPGDCDDLRDKMSMILKNNELRKAMESAARTWASNFDWDKSAKETLSLLQSVVDGRRGT